MVKQTKIPTLLGIFMLLLGVGASVFLVQTQKQTGTQASPDKTPQQVRITNVSDKSFTVSYVTDRATVGYLSWGKSSSLGQATDTDPISTIHHITVNNLSPQTTYYFKVGADKTLFTDRGKPYSVKTAPAVSSTPNNDVIFGTVLTQAGSPADAIVYISAQGVEPISTKTNGEGKWSISLSTARNTNLTNYASYSRNTQLDIVIGAGVGKSASAKILVGAAYPVPAIKIGEFDDFTNLKITSDGTPPSSQLNVPEGQSAQGASFNLSSFNQTDKKLIILTSPKDGEVLKSDQPQFSGSGTPGLVFTITVGSTTITDTITVAKNGTWKWTTPSKIDHGYHTVTLSWKDSAGITRTIIRSFSVAETIPSPSPSPVAAGSVNIASPLPSPKVTPSPSPIPSPSPSPTLKPSPSLKPATSSASVLPSAGELTTTLAMFIMGIVLVFVGILFPNSKYKYI